MSNGIIFKQMKTNYSQNNEQEFIRKYFKDFTGCFLDIGANDGKTLSNTYALALRGWIGVCIEPSPKAYKKLCETYKMFDWVDTYNFAIGTKSGKLPFYESGEHAPKVYGENVALLSSLQKSETYRFPDEDFEKIEVDCLTWKDVVLNHIEDTDFDMISIDAEGMDWAILKQMDLSYCKLLCIEWNGEQVTKHNIINYCLDFGLNMEYSNGENIILTR